MLVSCLITLGGACSQQFCAAARLLIKFQNRRIREERVFSALIGSFIYKVVMSRKFSFFSHFLKVVKENLNYELLKILLCLYCTASDFLSLIEISVLVISITNEVLGKQVMKVKKL